MYATYDVEQELSDKKVHSLIDQLNPSLRSIDEFDGKARIREFYEMSKEEAYSLLENIAAISGTLDRLHRYTPTGHEITDEEKALEIATEKREKRSPFSFFKCKIEKGEEIEFVQDRSVKAYVYDDRTILLNGKVTSLSASAQMLLNFNHPVQGTLYWMYKGKTLTALREEMEKAGTYD